MLHHAMIGSVVMGSSGNSNVVLQCSSNTLERLAICSIHGLWEVIDVDLGLGLHRLVSA